MAYPTVDAAYGFKPVNLVGGRVFAGSTRMIPITGGHGTSIYFGEHVLMSTNGTIINATATDSASGLIGVFMGCSYINSMSQRVYSQYFPASTAGTVDTVSMIEAYIVDDPQAVYRVAINTAAGAMSGRTRNCVGENAAIVMTAGSSVTGNSKFAVNSATATTTTLPLRIIDVVQDTKNASGSFTEVLVMWNPSIHLYTTATPV